MTCCNNVSIQRQDEFLCACVFRCSDSKGARVLGEEVTLTGAPTGPDHFIPGTPVFTEDGIAYEPLTVASLSSPATIGFGIVTCGPNVDAGTVYPFKFQPEIVTKGEYWTDRVAFPASFTAANKVAAIVAFRSNGLEGAGVYA